MDFLSKAQIQLTDLFKTMSVGARMTAVLLLVVVVISVAYLFQFPSNSADDFLFGGRAFSSNELANMEAAFSKAALNNYEVEGNRIRVPRSQRSAYVAALAESEALPRDFDSIIVPAFQQSSPWESTQARRDRIEQARQQELAMAIRVMPGIENATVQIDEAKLPGFRRETELTAMIGIRASGSGKIDPQVIESIRQLVAAAKAGLSPEQVTVTDLSSGFAYPGGGSDGPISATQNIYLTWKTRYEEEWKQKARDLLAFIPDVRIAVNVELDPTLMTNETGLNVDPKAVAVDITSTVNSERSTSPIQEGRPGVGSQSSANQASAVASTGPESSSESSEEHSSLIPSVRRTHTETGGLTPQKVTYAVSVPDSYFIAVYEEKWLSQNELAEGEEIPKPNDVELQAIESATKSRVENMLTQIIPKQDSAEDNFPKVSFTSFPVLSVKPMVPEGMVSKATGWLGANWNMVGMLFMGGAGLLMLRGLIRGVPQPELTPTATPSALSLVEEETDGEAGGVEDGATPSRPKRRFSASGPNPKEDLADMVREDPDTAANILRAWIGDAA